MRGWVGDLALGGRLAVGGGRTSLARLALSTVGIAMAVAVLLVGASVGHMIAGRHHREDVGVASEVPVPGTDPVYYRNNATEFRGQRVDVLYVHAAGKRHAVPAGMRELPAQGELVASPALADLLRSPEGGLLRPRFPDHLIGVLDESMVIEPGDLVAYVGVGANLAKSPAATKVYGFGGPLHRDPVPTQLLLILVAGTVVLLIPVFIFVASTSRIAGVERDRRLSALRLVGAGARQVRRIAAAESLVSALAGLALGALAFLVGRAYADDVTLFGVRTYPADIVPDPVLVVLIVLAIPALAVLTALFALRRTIIEPLGVVREARPVRRRLWWRIAIGAAGAALLVNQIDGDKGSQTWVVEVSTGTALLLIGVPALLPWLVERVTGRIRGGRPSWQLAIRRLQLDSGTSARVVGGIAAVLAGAIALHTVLTAVARDIGLPDMSGPATADHVTADPAVADEALADLRNAPKVRSAHVVREVDGYVRDEPWLMDVMDCAAIRELAGVRDCVDGQAFSVPGYAPPRPGTRLELREYDSADFDHYTTVGTMTVPKATRSVRRDLEHGESLIVTPGVFGGRPIPADYAELRFVAGDLDADDVERIRNSVAALGPYVYLYDPGLPELSTTQRLYLAIRNSLYGGAVLTLLLCGLGLLVLALEQIRERRRPLAVLTAAGVPRGVLGRSMLWQVALPVALGVAVAVLTGIGLARLLIRLIGPGPDIDWAGVGYLSAAAAVLALAVSALTLPFLRGATRLSSLRTE